MVCCTDFWSINRFAQIWTSRMSQEMDGKEACGGEAWKIHGGCETFWRLKSWPIFLQLRSRVSCLFGAFDSLNDGWMRGTVFFSTTCSIYGCFQATTVMTLVTSLCTVLCRSLSQWVARFLSWLQCDVCVALFKKKRRNSDIPIPVVEICEILQCLAWGCTIAGGPAWPNLEWNDLDPTLQDAPKITRMTWSRCFFFDQRESQPKKLYMNLPTFASWGFGYRGINTKNDVPSFFTFHQSWAKVLARDFRRCERL